MMQREEWLGRILGTVRNIESREYQAKAWFGMGDTVSSPDELYNQLFDDLTFSLFLENYAGDLTDEQRSAWRDLETKLESYARVTPPKLDPRFIFNDPRWEEIRNSAHNFLEAFKGRGEKGGDRRNVPPVF